MASYASSNDIGSVPFPEIDGYRLIRVLNHGSASTVYLGEQTSLSRQVAIKVMMPHALGDEVSRRRFENEVRTIARLEHPHVVGIHEVGRTHSGLPYYAMPYMPRGHLGQRSFRKQVAVGDESRVIAIVRALLSALEYAHGNGVVHRDVKAENVLFDDVDRPLLADFGIALRRGYGPRVTATGLAVGSTAYMAPEQARGEEVDGRADLYSLAVLIWEMLTGELPYRAADALSMAVMHAQDPVPKLPLGLRHWQRFMQRALAKAPSARFQDVAQMRAAIDRIETRRSWPGQSLLRQIGAPLARHAALIAGLALALPALGLLAWWLGSRDNEGFFTASPEATAPVEVVDPTASMLRPLPEAPLQATLENARRQLDQRNLTAPDGDNALASVIEASRLEPANANVQALAGELSQALTAELIANLRDGRFGRAGDYQRHLDALTGQTGALAPELRKEKQRQVLAALTARVDASVAGNDRASAVRIAALAPDFGVPAAESARLAAHAKSAQPAAAAEPEGGATGIAEPHLQRRPVTVADYTRFAEATGRKPSLCRERGSLLRVLAPRDYRSPGFDQNGNSPVVCVSMIDAEAYALWLSQQTGHRYRVPTLAESRETAAVVSGRELSLWQRDCAQDCNRRRVSGRSWRSNDDDRLLQSSRGFDDVGFRLIRED
ncbi:bifunctional serine/threonine-protein kinase/formylglycine-generating enzyme family protein [Marilutibacter chinensis]|uniref:Bifunctional serine/threonine-protein kinase/formylglycine-generating enzyme family protein n=1 Tax=Marilutibacter chinensis TaxID=2912247 RepID=A0ABS9HWJ8_9GAMM|nr:bifunctional serine/threonine-protein kinase/formylglycine-generating enzyme family protein [Lysobacter chinensis]MCF7222705.1 bifunctional serine/threonine-protein kinase/formylglycine-generating enzyme family protein [Lysobacter chinensis]